MNDRETRNKFNYLSLFDKAKLIDGYGHKIHTVMTPDAKHEIHLFEIDGRFVELFWNNEKEAIDQIWMPSYSELDCYLKDISISSLLRILR